ncbi:hypothetical protein [Endothiovibrio diazotrophicus]
MTYLPDTLAAWGSPRFETVLKAEIEGLDAAHLPLQQGVIHGSYYSGGPVQAVLVSADEDPSTLHLRIGLFYTSVIAGCNCADDPTPMDEYREHCQIGVDLDRESGRATIVLLED